MKKLVFLVLFVPSFLQAQWHLDLFGGFANYYGDLQGQPFTLSQAKLAFGAQLQYDLTPHFALLSGFNAGSVGASDRYNKPSLQAMNLSFQTNLFEWNFIGEYTLLDLRDNWFSPYAFAGLAVYHFNPYAFDTLGNKVYLKPLSTEGEGLSQYPGVKPYNLTQLAIPFGGGVKFRVTDGIVVAYEIGFRKLFTDYLDDVSNRYVDPAILLADKGPLAVEMSYRGNEVKGGDPNYPAPGSLRGSPKNKDWYYFSGIKVSISLDNPITRRLGYGIMPCPKKVY
ncbi:MAG: DUF6089 family protein [Puia sp.]|nr:DUF6089 family protein [Puia sp.]